jgi:hypothetical protein
MCSNDHLMTPKWQGAAHGSLFIVTLDVMAGRYCVGDVGAQLLRAHHAGQRRERRAVFYS